MTYARARLLTGVGGVGVAVVLAAVALATKAPHRSMVGEAASWAAGTASLTFFLGCAVVAQMSFDLLGGYVLPRRYGRQSERFTSWLGRWARGVATQNLVCLASLAALLAAGRAYGTVAALGVFAVVTAWLVAYQGALAFLVGGTSYKSSVSEGSDSELVEATHVDPGFTGGIVGWPGNERIVVPRLWVEMLPPDEIAAVSQRRRVALVSGSRLNGLIASAAWNFAGLTVSAAMPMAGFESAAAIGTTVCWFVLWSFVGLLTLPTYSRRASHWIDAEARRRGVSGASLFGALARIDRLQDDEPARPRLVTSVFYPTPTLTSRTELYAGIVAPRPGLDLHAWHVARMALYLGWACGNPLSRAVHCNAGRPELWAMLPTD